VHLLRTLASCTLLAMGLTWRPQLPRAARTFTIDRASDRAVAGISPPPSHVPEAFRGQALSSTGAP